MISKLSNFQVLTPNGWSDFGGVKKTSSEVLFTIQFTDGTTLKCTDNHQLKYPTGEFLEASQVKVGDELFGGKVVSNKDYEIGEFDVYDLIDVELENEYYTSGVVSHNCAFIPDMDEIWTSAQMTLATGGNAIVLSTPNGINLFHQIWQNAENGDAEDGLDKFNPIKLPWYLHPERDGNWRKQQDVILGKRNAAQECFTGETLIYTDKGLCRIDSIKVGDLVLTDKCWYKPVTRLYVKESSDIYEVTTVQNQEPIYVTGNHPIMVQNRGWVDVVDIQPDDHVAVCPVERDGGLYYEYSKVNKIEKTDRIETVYNLEVEDHHTYVTDHFVVHNCDAEFLSSGHTVVDADDIAFYTANTVQEPIEKRGIGGDIWIWRYPDYSKSYATAVDPARGDGEDYSTILIFEVESMEQVVEFKGKVDPQTLGHMAVSLSTEYNDALLIIDNKNVGFGTVQVALDKNYPNLYRTYRHDPYLDEAVHLTKGYDLKSEQDTVPGFTISTKIRPVLISKLENYLREREVIVRSKRLVNEMYVFVWLNGKAQAQRGYNDDLIMALAMFFYVRDTALRLRQLGIELIRSSLRSIHKPVYKSKPLGAEKWEMTINGKQESIKWLINR